ncbi:ATP-binding cassette domain-containing protein [Bacillus aquiflavi]|uniref:ATP-binding cassette domain-containing protein n=1 Tax=Bacillus aquiflavi TaxID=2672567 RepID=A0A6B3W721_9BACI|nr:ATP-binding cassette domain-containing protein [Bacillus aquiflavi]MBA4538845.1 ATP-binding cassette domain-containing protein [Bacillus aquiflavi]NEY83204.1 ATP-binding cassette domain-containing protein [Bacillus aquiflavi]
MIEIKNVSKRFGERILFDNLNMKINDGDFVAFSGPSGCGKTTLLNMIGAIESVDNGKIIVDGINVHEKKNQLLYFREKVGFLFQNFALVDHKTVEQNLEIVRKDSRNDISVEEALKMVGMENTLKKKVYTLSGGEQQRVALARLILKKSTLILADEPTGSLDKRNAEIVMSILKEMNKKGKTIILVTHDEEIKGTIGRVIEL